MNTNRIRVMSCNLRTDVAADGINCFGNRRERLLEAILSEKPDVIGFQEAKGHMRQWLRENLTGYTLLGCGREADFGGEGIPVAYRSADWELLSFETRWLSPTPQKPGSRYEKDQSHCPRIYHAVELVRQGEEKPLCMINVHTDHRGSQARVLGCEQLIAECQRYANDVVVITGDFNATPDAPEICMMTERCGALRLTDATEGLSGTFHGFGTVTPVKIDYVFTNVAHANARQLHPTFSDGVYLSDHDPVLVDIAWKTF